MHVETYLTFNGRCEEAVAFYNKVIGAEFTTVMRFKDSPEPHPPGMLPAGFENKVMHSVIKIGDTTVMATDGCGGEPGFNGFSLTIAVEDVAEATRIFNALSAGGKVTMPLSETFFAKIF